MTLGLRGRLLVASIVVLTVSVLVADVVLRRILVAELVNRIETDLEVRASLAADAARRQALNLDDVMRWENLADELSARMNARVTFVAHDGRVLSDSKVDSADLGTLENHASREEIVQAFDAGTGHSLRDSPSIGQRMMYVAHTFEVPGQPEGVARVAVPLTQVEAAVARLRGLIALASVIGLIIAVVLSSAGAHWASQNARRLAEAARRMAEGDLSTRTHSNTDDEFGELGGNLDKLATRLSMAFNDLRAERDLLGGILAGMGEGVLLVDEAGKVALVNHGLRDMLLIGQDAVGQPLGEVIEDADLAAIIEEARATRTTISAELEIEGLKPRRLLVRALALSPQPAGTLAVFVDVTDLRRLEKLRRDFVANVSHELRTPVTAIRSATETLLDGASRDPNAAPMFVEMIDRNARRLHSLVEDLLDLSRLEAKEYRLNTAPVALAEALPQALALFKERAARKQVALTCVDASSAPVVTADPRALEQVLANFLENAIKYCPPGSHIRVSTRSEPPGHARVLVTDTGPGIEEKHLHRLFERFYRVDKGRSRDIGGTGLGLSIVKHLVEAMNGRVGVESAPGKGSTFWFTIPVAVAATEPDELPHPQASGASS